VIQHRVVENVLDHSVRRSARVKNDLIVYKAGVKAAPAFLLRCPYIGVAISSLRINPTAIS
jgi:hypothetical protein